ncbi:MAG: PHB depolymerase family esterase [Polyangiaceae bacterium]
MRYRWKLAALALGASMASVAGAHACGSDGSEPAGFSHGNDASADVFTGSDAFVWPDADPAPDTGTGPSPGFDAGSDSGSGAAICSGKTGETGSGIGIEVQSGGRTRTSLLHVPDKYDATKGAMLVLNFHGFGSAGWQEALLSRMSQASDERGFLVAYPEGIVTSWNAGDCCGTAWTDSVDDVKFVRDLLDAIAEKWCIDPKRIYATGMSNGGFLSHRLACEASDRIAAIAPVAGVLGVEPNLCTPPRPVPVLHFHGTSDPIVPYGGGTPLVPQLGLGLVFRSVADTLEHWRKHNACSGFATPFFENGDTKCVRWPDCKDGVETALCSIDGGGHTWPGGVPIPLAGKTSSDISATEAMLDFFEAHPLP